MFPEKYRFSLALPVWYPMHDIVTEKEWQRQMSYFTLLINQKDRSGQLWESCVQLAQALLTTS